MMSNVHAIPVQSIELIHSDVGRSVIFSAAAIFMFLSVIFQRPSGVLLPLSVIFTSLISTLGLMAFVDIPISPASQLFPPLILAVGVADSVHLLTIFYQRLQTGLSNKDSLAYAMKHSGLAMLFTTLTTAGGFLSFTFAEILPIMHLGIISSLGVILTLVYTLLLIPALISLFPVVSKKGIKGNRQLTLLTNLLRNIGSFAVKNNKKVLMVSAIIAMVSSAGVLRLKFSHDVLSWFPEGHELRENTYKINKKMKFAVTMEIIVDTGRPNGLYDPEIMNKLEQMSRYSESLKDDHLRVGKASSIADILKQIHQALNENNPDYYKIPQTSTLIAQELLLFENGGTDDLEELIDSEFSKARVTVRIPWADAIFYIPLRNRIENKFREVFEGKAEIIITGNMDLLTRSFMGIIKSMGTSYILAFVIVAIMMVLLIGDISAGMLSMIPNVLPLLISLGIMGFFDLPIDLFTVLLGGIALGIVVDDTVHFFHNFSRYYGETGDPAASVDQTMETVGQAMLFTSMILTSGFFMFMVSTMDNLFYIGLMMGITIINAFLADILLTPALLSLMYTSKNRSKHTLKIPLGILFFIIISSLPVFAEQMTAKEVMEKNDSRYTGDTSIQNSTMILIDKRGKQRVRQLKRFTKEERDVSRTMIFFLSPSEIKNTAFLSYDWEDKSKQDESWLYLPALNKVKRISSDDKSGSFLGSDFSIADVEEVDIDYFQYEFISTGEKLDGHDVWVILEKPKHEIKEEVIDITGYLQSQYWVRKDNFMIAKGKYWVKKGKRIKYFKVSEFERIDNIWTRKKFKMITTKNRKITHSTVIIVNSTEYNKKIDSNMFTPQRMDRGL